MGNKVDLANANGGELRAVQRSEALKLASEHELIYFETSAKENINLKEVMEHIMQKVYANLYLKKGEDDIEARESIVIGAGGTTANQGGWSDCSTC